MALSAAQRKHLEKRLLDERARAQRTLSRSVAENADGDEQGRAGDLTSMPLHMADLGTDTMQQELDASNATRVSRELAEIDAALERLYQTPEKFGRCEDTGCRRALEAALAAADSAPRYREALLKYPKEEARFFQFKEHQALERAQRWLASVGIPFAKPQRDN